MITAEGMHIIFIIIFSHVLSFYDDLWTLSYEKANFMPNFALAFMYAHYFHTPWLHVTSDCTRELELTGRFINRNGPKRSERGRTVTRNYETDRNGTKRTGKAQMVAAWRQLDGPQWLTWK